MDVHKEAMGPCNRYKEEICAEEEKSVSIVERRAGRGA